MLDHDHQWIKSEVEPTGSNGKRYTMVCARCGVRVFRSRNRSSTGRTMRWMAASRQGVIREFSRLKR